MSTWSETRDRLRDDFPPSGQDRERHNAQLDAWAAYISQREDRIEALEEALRRFHVYASYPAAVPKGQTRAKSGCAMLHIQGIGYFWSRDMLRSQVEATVEEIRTLLSTTEPDHV